MRTCPEVAIEAVLDLTPLHFVVENIAKTITIRMIKEGTTKHKSQYSEVD